MPQYRYIDSPDYVRDLDFAYVETYSLLRGKPNADFYNQTNREAQKLERAIEKSDLPLPEQKRDWPSLKNIRSLPSTYLPPRAFCTPRP